MLHEFTSQNFEGGVGGGGGGAPRLFLESEQKRDQARSKALEIYSRQFCRKSNTRIFNLDFYSTNSDGCP